MNLSEIGKALLHIEDQPLLFHQGFFLLIFAIFLIIYSFFLKKEGLRKTILILFSIYFYYKASGIYLFLLLCTISADYLFSYLIDSVNHKYKKFWLISGVVFSISILGYYKYRNFFLENIWGHSLTLESLILPIGISFYTFQSISYMVDVYKRKINRPSFINYLIYMLFFPHLVAGPIVRAKDFIPQLNQGISITKSKINEGLYLIIKGLIKKAIIADYIAQYSDIVFSTPDGFSGTEHIIATLCYTLQIFCDFSGYTDMAIGVALLLGYRLCLNFDSPYKAINITQFWRRWHISLSSWLRDYIYIPLGGNKRGGLLQLAFLVITMLIGGFWHGADWKFIFWGLAHGLLLVFHKLYVRYLSGRLSVKSWLKPLWLILTFSSVSLLWIPFRANSMDDTWLVYRSIFFDSNWNVLLALINTNPYLFIFLCIGFSLTLIPNKIKLAVMSFFFKTNLFVKIILLVVIIQLIIQMRSEVVQPFIYFQF